MGTRRTQWDSYRDPRFLVGPENHLRLFSEDVGHDPWKRTLGGQPLFLVVHLAKDVHYVFGNISIRRALQRT
jgi:hypothetical protein